MPAGMEAHGSIAWGALAPTQHLSLLHTGLARWYLPEARDTAEQLSSHAGDTGVAAVKWNPTLPPEVVCHCCALLGHTPPVPSSA